MPADTPVYPIARPAAGHGDARFSVGLPSTAPSCTATATHASPPGPTSFACG
jgi:hypothetical protein